jgi:energy-coupling factor transport system ATP-binding protein
MIRIENLSASIRKTPILSDIGASVGEGEFVALVGPNGAGKTTLLKHLNGLLKPTKGSVAIAGVDTRKTKTSELARLVGFLFQNPDQQILCMSVREEIRFGLKHTGVPRDEWDARMESAAAITGLSKKIDADPLLLTRSRRQRVALASVLATGPEILVLDEPTSAQDEVETTRVMEIAQGLVRAGKTVILVSHDMELVSRYATRALVLVGGKLVADLDPADLFADDELLERASLSKPGLHRLAESLGYSREGKMSGSLSVRELADFVESSAIPEATP